MGHGGEVSKIRNPLVALLLALTACGGSSHPTPAAATDSPVCATYTARADALDPTRLPSSTPAEITEYNRRVDEGNAIDDQRSPRAAPGSGRT